MLGTDNPQLNHGLTLSSSGDTLYASSAEAVFAWPYNARAGAVTDASNPRTVVANMSNSDLITRTLLVSRAHPGMLLVSRGSAEDDAARTEVLANGLSQIKVFNLTNLTEGREYNFNEDGLVLGWGLRNSVGVAEHPVTGGVYAVENSVDGVHRNGVDVHENNPGEELNFLGYVNGTGTGKNFGYPTCFAVWKVDEIPDNDGLGVGKQFAVQETGTNRDETCAEKYQPPRLTFPAHYAPIDIEFDGNGKEAFVSFRGSCESKTPLSPCYDSTTNKIPVDRSSPVGYRVSSISFNPSTGDPVASTDSTNALAADIITNKDNSVCPDKCFRPVGLAFDSQGRLWMASDSTGEIYVLQKTGEGGEGKFVGADGNNDGGQGTGEENAAAGRGALGLGWVLAAGVGAWLAMA